LSESPATQLDRVAKHEICSDSNGEAPDASLWKGCSAMQREPLDGGQVGESGRIEWGRLSQLEKAFNRGVGSGLARWCMMYARVLAACERNLGLR
jgi:hypothetical protein